MTGDDVRELLGAYALDALDDDERQAVEELLARDPSAAQEARELLATAELMGAAVARTPPADLRSATLARAAQTSQLPARDAVASTQDPAASEAPEVPAHALDTEPRPARGPSGSTGPGRRTGRTGPSSVRGTSPVSTRSRRRAWFTGIAAVLVLAVGVAVPSTLAWQQSQRAAEAEARADRITSLLASPDAQVIAAELSTGGSAVAVVTPEAALVSAEGVTDPGDGRVYQLWVMRDGTPVPDGTARVTDGAIEVYTTAYRAGDALALTVEPTGGSPAPTTDPVVLLAPA